MTAAPAERRAALYLYGFVLCCLASQIALLFEVLGSFRLVFRTAAFGSSLVLLFLVIGRRKRHPAQPWTVAALLLVGLGLLQPTTNSLLSGTAHFALYVAIAAPLFWVARLDVTPTVFRRLLLVLWVFHTLSAAVGVLQTHYPELYQPNVSSTILGMGEMADAYKMRLADGQYVWRPMGLTDTPGGAASAGLAAVLYGLGFLLQSRSGLWRAVSVGSLTVGLFCLYICQVRSLLVMAGVCSVTLIAVLLYRGEVKRLIGLTAVLPVLVVVALLWAVSVGGESTVLRLSTLVEDNPTDVYNQNRGLFLQHTFADLLPEYPFGAGLARWGMMRNYFGNPQNADSPAIWVEIQWTGWLLDGGLPLMVVYAVAVAVACWVSLRVALSRLPGDLPLWGGVVFGLNVGTVAVTFNYPIFMSQGGMEFWMLNTALFSAAVASLRQARLRQNDGEELSKIAVSSRAPQSALSANRTVAVPL
jgi:hypothetical protein